MNRSRNLVLGALTLVVLLAAALGFRWAAAGKPAAAPPVRPPLVRWTTPAPPGRIPLPVRVDAPKVPCWSCSQSEKWPIRFQTDLDVLAPLGDGPANAALWLKDFAKPQGARLAEAEAAMKRRLQGPADYLLVLAPDDPLLGEAEPWADQATMRFYPDVWTAEGASTPIPNLLVALSLAKSWAARAAAHPDAPSAIEDCRRAIRWGRLLRQEDATLIQDLVGLACIRIGAEELYALAARRGDHALMLAAAIVQGEVAPQRLRTAEAVTRLSFPAEGERLVTDRKVDDLVAAATASLDRRFRCEAITYLVIVRGAGTPAQQERVRKTLEGLKDAPDALVAGHARWALSLPREDS